VIASEKTSLASGFLAAGVAGVIATAWAVSDRSTLLLVARFAELWRGENLAPRRALSLAQRWLRDATASEIAEWARAQALVSDTVAAGTLELVANAMDRRSAAERPYAHSHFWAAFSYHGA
jgi:CHAT domain-containing protein